MNFIKTIKLNNTAFNFINNKSNFKYTELKNLLLKMVQEQQMHMSAAYFPDINVFQEMIKSRGNMM